MWSIVADLHFARQSSALHSIGIFHVGPKEMKAGSSGQVTAESGILNEEATGIWMHALYRGIPCALNLPFEWAFQASSFKSLEFSECFSHEMSFLSNNPSNDIPCVDATSLVVPSGSGRD